MKRILQNAKNLFRSFYLPIIVILFIVILFYGYFILSLKNNNIIERKETQIYFADNISDAHLIAIKKFNKINRGQIRVIPIDLPFEKFSTNERKELLARSLRSKSDRIDIYTVDQIWVNRFAKWGESLGKYFPTTERNKLLDYALETCYVDNDLVAIPFYIDVSVMFYRDEKLEKLADYQKIKNKLSSGITWEEFIELKNRMMNDNEAYYIFPADDYEGLVCSFIELILNQDRSYFSANKISLETKEARKALQHLVDLVQKYKISPNNVCEFKETSCYNYFINEDALFVRAWPGFKYEFQQLSKGKLEEIKLGKAPLPYFRGTQPASIFGGWNLMLSKYSKHKPEAVEFLRFLLSDHIQELLYEEGGVLPGKRNIYENEKLLMKHQDLEFYYKLFKMGVHRPFLPDYTRISDIISYYVHSAIKGEIPVNSALRKATDLINSGRVMIK